jgi:hypothetical protein
MGWVNEGLKAGKFDRFQLHGVLCREKRGSNKRCKYLHLKWEDDSKLEATWTCFCLIDIMINLPSGTKSLNNPIVN